MTEQIRGKYIADYWCEDEELIKDKPPEEFERMVPRYEGVVVAHIPNDKIKKPVYKYSEDESIAEISKYIAGTYGEHYATDNNIQSFDVWEALAENSDPTPTHRDTAIKYLYRYGKKNGHNRKDLLKVVHYILMLLHYNKKHHGK